MEDRGNIASLLEETRRELAVFASDSMGAQTFFGQFEHTGLTRRERRELRDWVEGTAMPHMVIDPRPGLRIIDINEAYAQATITDRGRAPGEKLFDVFPDNPLDPGADGVSNLYESIRQAAQSGRMHTMAVQRYDVRDHNGCFVRRYWQPTNTPIFDDAGRLLYILHHGNPVTPR